MLLLLLAAALTGALLFEFATGWSASACACWAAFNKAALFASAAALLFSSTSFASGADWKCSTVGGLPRYRNFLLLEQLVQ